MFLSHPKVRGSPVIYRRSFIERKGLTKEEIDESFRRVPDPPPAVTTTQSVVRWSDKIFTERATTTSSTSTETYTCWTCGQQFKNGDDFSIQLVSCYFFVGFLAASGAGTAVLLKVHDVIYEVVGGDARSVLCEAVEKHHASVLVVGSHGYGVIKWAV